MAVEKAPTQVSLASAMRFYRWMERRWPASGWTRWRGSWPGKAPPPFGSCRHDAASADKESVARCPSLDCKLATLKHCRWTKTCGRREILSVYFMLNSHIKMAAKDDKVRGSYPSKTMWHCKGLGFHSSNHKITKWHIKNQTYPVEEDCAG